MFEIKQFKDGRGSIYDLVVGDERGQEHTECVDLIMLTYNSEDYLEYCIKSLEEQVVNIYALDNGSKDNTLKILKNYDIDFITSNKKGDLSYLMNQNLKRVPKDRWLFYVNPDEILYDLPRGFIGKYCDFLEKNNIFCSDVRFPDFVYNYRTLFAGFDWGEGPGVYWTARRLFKYTGKERFKNPVHFNISNTKPGDIVEHNYEHTGEWTGKVAKTTLIMLFHFGKLRGIERQRGKGARLVNGDMLAQGLVPTVPYMGKLPKVLGFD